ncbi:MAG TPA: TatD family hydrolase, partial [Cyclobacteriaceae bacterium]|nr:TatD family hydrolase [Cyclobacteriaceae bacterium]
MSYYADTHAHIYADDFDRDRDELLSRCQDENVRKVIMPNIDQSSVDAMLEVENRFPNQCIATMGLHPCSVKKGFERELYNVETWLAKRKFAAVGEIGTDLYWDKSFWSHQQEAFNVQMGWAKQYGLPIII